MPCLKNLRGESSRLGLVADLHDGVRTCPLAGQGRLGEGLGHGRPGEASLALPGRCALALGVSCAGTPPPFLGTRRADFDNVQAGDDPYVRQAMATLKEGESNNRFFEVLDSISEKKAAKGNAALIEAVGVGRACSSVHMRVCKKVSTCVRR